MQHTRTLLTALLLAPLAALHAQQPTNSTAAEYAAWPADSGAKFLKASLDPASLKVLAMLQQKPPIKSAGAGGPKYDSGELSKLLLLKATTGPVSPAELQALEHHLLAYPLPRCNVG